MIDRWRNIDEDTQDLRELARSREDLVEALSYCNGEEAAVPDAARLNDIFQRYNLLFCQEVLKTSIEELDRRLAAWLSLEQLME